MSFLIDKKPLDKKGRICKLDETAKTIKTRPANEEDLQSVLVLAKEFMSGEADNEKRVDVLKQVLRNPNYELLVAELGEEIVGFIDHWIIYDFVHGARLSYIHNLYVSSKHACIVSISSTHYIVVSKKFL